MIARSEEAKSIGIRMGVPLHQIKKLIAEHQIKVFSSNYAFYADMSARLINCLASAVHFQLTIHTYRLHRTTAEPFC